MRLDNAGLLLDHHNLALESGWVRQPDGTATVAARTHMIGCTGAMVAWWFGFIHTTDQYLWWHPRDHVWSDWDGERGTGRYVGGTHLVHEYIGGEFRRLMVNFRDPAAILDPARFAQARVGAAIYARIGEIGVPFWQGHLLHLVHDMPEGCVMRSRFWLGHLEPAPPGLTPEGLAAQLPEAMLQGLHRHCCEEMAILAGFLPTLWRLHNPSAEPDGQRRVAP